MDHSRRTMTSEGPLGNALPYTSAVPSSDAKRPHNRSALPRPSVGFGYTLPLHVNHSQIKTNDANMVSSGNQVSHEKLYAGAKKGMASRRSTSTAFRGLEVKDHLHNGNRSDIGMNGKTPQGMRNVPNSLRRNSIFASANHGRPSIVPPSYSSTTVKDSRPVRDKGFQNSCARSISDYLQALRCPTPITPKTLVSPTAKEFQSIFRFLISDLVDSNMVWTKRFEDDVLSILKDLRYPGMDSVHKTAITAPGAPQSWPGLLAMLSWLVELCKAHENWNDPGCISDPLLASAYDLPPEDPHVEDRLLWDFSCKTYSEWFDGGAEDFPRAEQELAELYERMAAANVEDLEAIDMSVQKRTVELHQLQAQEPPLKKLEDEYVQLMGDKTKFIAFIDLHKQKADKTKQAIAKLRMVVSEQEQELAGSRTELGRIEEAVAMQNLAPDEVNRMNHERESLGRSLEELRARIADASQIAYDHEMAVTKSMDRFENLLVDYTSLGHHIGLIHPTSDPLQMGSSDINYAIDLDLGAEDLDHIRAAGARMRSNIWQGMQAHREAYRLDAQRLRNDIIVLEDMCDRIEQRVDRQSGEASNLEARLKVVHEQADEAQSLLAAENANNNKIIAQLESEVTSMMAQSQQSVLSTQSQLESTRIAFKELRHKTALLQDSVVADVGGYIDAVIKAKEHAANSLRSIRTLAESQ